MSKKHNAKHPARARSNYPHRLEARGLSRTPELKDLDYLRKKQERRTEEFVNPWPRMGDLA